MTLEHKCGCSGDCENISTCKEELGKMIRDAEDRYLDSYEDLNGEKIDELRKLYKTKFGEEYKNVERINKES